MTRVGRSVTQPWRVLLALTMTYQNNAELEAVLQIARRFQEEGRSYRIITPYEAQRTAIENEMKVRDLIAKDKVFAVDSFQGK
jgi:superfamily I DNA and/or RNA helicase